jgi:hypothetical protein
MGVSITENETIIRHFEGLTPDMVQEIIDFIEFLKIRRMEKSNSAQSTLVIQQQSLDRIWHNESEDLYEI